MVFALTALAVEHQQSKDMVRIMLISPPLVYDATTIAQGSIGTSKKKLIMPLTASPAIPPIYPAKSPIATPMTRHAIALEMPTIRVERVATMSCEKMS